MKERLFVILAVIGLQVTSVAPLAGQGVADPAKADRGIAPMVTYAASDFETINPYTGNVLYAFPIAKLAPGRGGSSAGLSLTYNSTIFDANLSQNTDTGVVTANLVPSYSGGGWRYSYQYGLWEETIPMKECASDSANVRFSVVAPDGGRHILQLYNGGYANEEDGGTMYLPNGQPSCPGVTPITSGNLTWYTTDGTFIRVVTQAVNAPWTNYEWTMYFSDGTQANGFGSQAVSILDRDDNLIAFTNIDRNTSDDYPISIIEDTFGHFINFRHLTSFTDYIAQVGFAGQNLAAWTVNWGTTSIASSNKYVCLRPDPLNQLCSGSLNTPVVTSITVGAPANLTYTFNYDDQSAPGGLGWGELRQVKLPASSTDTTPASVTYAYSLQQGVTRDYDSLSNPIVRKEVDWQEEYDGQPAAGTPDVWTYQGGGSLTPLVIGPDGGQTQYFYQNGTIGQGLAYKILYPGPIEVDRTWDYNVPYRGSAGGTAPVNPYIQTETKTVGGQTTTTTYSVDTNGNQTSASVVWNGTPIRSTAAAFNLCGAPSGGWCAANARSTPAADDSNAYWNPSSPQLRNLLTRKVVTDQTSTPHPTGTVDEYQYSSTGDMTEERHWNSAAPGQPATSSFVAQPLTASNSVTIDRTYNSSNLTGVTDGRGISTIYTYDSNNLYPTQKSVSGVVQEYYSFDASSGLLANKTDRNQVNDCRYYDAFNRLYQLWAACNTTPLLTSTTYEDTNRRTIATDGGGRVSITEYDQLRRVALNRQLENPGTQGVDDSSTGIKVQTRYKNLSANSQGYRLVSNPYRASTSSAASSESTMGWTVTTLDTAGRPTQVQTFSGSALPSPWGSSTNGAVATTYSYSGTARP